MELQLEKRKIFQNQAVYSGSNEQSIEMDYILPDYYSDIFKIIKCMLIPTVTAVSSSSGRISYDVNVSIRIIYISDDDNSMKCVEQKYTYSKNIEHSATDVTNINITPKVEYCNCRAINERRLSIRGTINCCVLAESLIQKEIPNNCDGSGIQLKKRTMVSQSNVININKMFSYTEDVHLPESKESIKGILSIKTNLYNIDYKIITNKIIVKSICKATITYVIDGEIKTHNEQIHLSNIIDADGITDEHECKMILKINGCEYELEGSETAELVLTINAEIVCKAYCKEQSDVIEDAYSTEYECELKKDIIENQSFNSDIDVIEDVITNIKLEDVSSIEAVLVSLSDMPERIKGPVFSGSVNVLIIGKNSTGEIIYAEKSSVFEYDTKLTLADISGIVSINENSTNYTLYADGTIDVKTELSVKASVFTTESEQIVSDIQLTEEKNTQLTDNHGIKIYYAQPGESIWKIAKTYNSKADIIMKENEITDEILSEKCALLIPMVF